jgi:hypothetical protein
MSGYTTYQRWQRIEAQAAMMGFRLANPKHGAWCGIDRGPDQVALYARNDSLPAYSRDAELFVGTFSEVETFLIGWGKAQQYDYLLRMTDPKRRLRFEAKEIERQRLEKERLEKRKMFAVLSSRTEEAVDRLVK